VVAAAVVGSCRDRVTIDMAAGLEQGQLVLLVQQVRTDEARVAGADDRQSHTFL
jgi:hypothetical protein